ncbi:MAG: EamA family transporter [Oscillospiraceae bacterium]|nr:EamA family transporter [Oscillospiraceae bacterium]
MWIIFALLSAFFAACVAILAKLGLEGVNSHLAVAIRTIVVCGMAWGLVFMTGAQGGISQFTQRNWIFLILSGIATGLSWLFYFRALQIGEVSRVVPIDKLSVVLTMALAFIILGETVTAKAVIGGLLIVVGTIVIVLP